MNIGAVIDAAGIPAKADSLGQLTEIDSLTVAERVVVNFQRLGVKDIVMITGYRAEQVEKTLRRFGITFLRNENYESAQMLDSAKLGLRYLRERCGKVLFCPVDVPFFMEDTAEQLLETSGEFILPVCQEQPGYPVCIDSPLIPAILEYQGNQGFQGALTAVDVEPVCLPVQDEGILTGAESQSVYQELAKVHDEKLMRPQVKVRLINKKPFFGPGTMTLLKQIDSLGSVKEACARTGISYSKGWKMIRSAEEELGYNIVGRQTGGKNGGAAFLTDKGKRLLLLFEEYEAKVEKAAYEIYDQIFFDSELF
ncbi:MAG: NTP transferase domain-containing protein [Ruminococcus sp.]|jgi:molybdate transport repressor ModE-like protein|nr:NTP transferase domain-containing protein [Ruminococcus sp.]